MSIEPPTADEIESDLQHEVTNRNPDINGWFDQTSNESLISVFANTLSTEYQYLVYVGFASTLRYSGKELTIEDLQREGIDPDTVDLALINSLQSDADLEAAAAEKGKTRDPGSYARGEVEITFTSAGASAKAGLEFTVEIDDDTTYSYVTTEPLQADENATIATAPIRAVARGDEYNIGAERVTGISDVTRDRTAIQRVSNSEPVVGGEGPESNDSLRERARGAELENATAEQRLITALDVETEGGGGVTEKDINVEEYPLGVEDPNSEHDYSYANWIINYNGPVDADHLRDSDGGVVEGGLQGLINAEKPHGFAWYYVAPEVYVLDVTAEIAPREPTQTKATKNDIDSAGASKAVVSMLSSLGLGDDLYTVEIEQTIMDADPDIAYPVTLTLDLKAPDGTTTSLERSSRYSVSQRQMINPGTVTLTAVDNPQVS